MSLRTYAGTTGLLGGAAWVARYFVTHDGLWWAGLALLTLACAATGAGLVSSSAVALRMLVTVAFPALVASLWWVVRDAVDDVHLVDAAFGAAVAVVAVIALGTSSQGMTARDR